MSRRDTIKTLQELRRELSRMEGYRLMLRKEGITETPANDSERERLRLKIAELERK